jgi:hypothetical protein
MLITCQGQIAHPELPEKLIADFFSGTLQTGVNACDH